MSEPYTPLEQWLYDTGIAMPGAVRPVARQIEASDWLAEHDRQVAERAWDEGYTRGNAHNGRRDDCPYRAAKGEQK